METIIGCIITGGLSLVGVVLSNLSNNKKIENTLSTQQAVTDTKSQNRRFRKEGKLMTVQLLVYVITTLFTYILGKISKHFGWNETLPIPIQNILIGIIATIIGCIIHIEGLDANSIIQAVVTALGGIGTATVLYDAKNQ